MVDDAGDHDPREVNDDFFGRTDDFLGRTEFRARSPPPAFHGDRRHAYAIAVLIESVHERRASTGRRVGSRGAGTTNGSVFADAGFDALGCGVGVATFAGRAPSCSGLAAVESPRSNPPQRIMAAIETTVSPFQLDRNIGLDPFSINSCIDFETSACNPSGSAARKRQWRLVICLSASGGMSLAVLPSVGLAANTESSAVSNVARPLLAMRSRNRLRLAQGGFAAFPAEFQGLRPLAGSSIPRDRKERPRREIAGAGA